MFNPPRFPLLYGPTPLHRMDRVSADLGQEIWIKRDDLTGFAMGGNKARKLEFLMAEVVASGCDHVVSAGSTQSNFIRQLGAACLVAGLGCSAVAMNMPYDGPAGKPTYTPADHGGNVTLNEILGVELRVVPDGVWEDLDEARHELVREKEGQGLRVYEIPVGGSTPLGAYGFYRAGLEFLEQGGDRFATLITASSSGSTHTGLSYALAGSSVKVVGIACDPEPEMPVYLSEMACALDDLVGLGVRLGAKDFDFRLDWVGQGYNVPSEEGEAAKQYLLEKEGIFLDSVYTAKGFAGLLGLVRSGQVSGPVCFWHTGGMPALFAY